MFVYKAVSLAKGCGARLIHRIGARHATLALFLGFVVVRAIVHVQTEAKGVTAASVSEIGIRGDAGHPGSAAPAASVLTVPKRWNVSLASPTAARVDSPISEPTHLGRLLPSPTAVPLPTPDGELRRVVVPVLMYHHVMDPASDANAIQRDLSVSPANFEAQLQYLIERGYQAITLKDLIMYLQLGQPLPPKPVVLTFDDGFKDQYTNAYPLLERHDYVGTFFIITRFADEAREEHMSWMDIGDLHANGMEIGSHSYTHPSLRGKSFDYIVWQVLGSKEAIEARTHEPVRFFSYPSGQYDQLAIDVLRSAGYWGAVTVEAGSLQSSERTFELKRIRVRGSYDLQDFDYWLNHWLAHP